MEEELSENESEERMYGMIHFIDGTQKNVSTNPKDFSFVENVSHCNIGRYWHKSSEYNSPYKKVNTPKEIALVKALPDNSHQKDEDENNTSPYTIFQQPVPQNIKKTIEILETEDLNRVVELESSDEDEVIEIALPPKPTITIESSDEDDVCAVSLNPTSQKTIDKPKENKASGNREVTASPVPSVVSSISDEFIRGDCIALNISSKYSKNQSFDFSLHGTDLLVQTPTKKRKKKRNKDATSTPIANSVNLTTTSLDECFATPKIKGKNKRQKIKSYRVSEKSIPNADVYDSDSNQSTNEGNKIHNVYSVTDKSLPNIDVYESDLNQSEIIKKLTPQTGDVVINEIDSSNSSGIEDAIIGTPKTTKKNSDTLNKSVIVDLTELDSSKTIIDENIIMGNVSGFTEVDDNEEILIPQDIPKCGSTKIPAILNEDLDFDNLKGNKTCKKRRYSLSTLRAEMEKFYNESWGGEDFNHREIQKNMSRDKSLWVIDPKDRMSSMTKRKIMCNYCNRVGHRDDTCRMKPPICFMCGSAGHFEPRCPRKICVNCASPNYMYSTMCRNCSSWQTLRCSECGQNGHPSSHCPDVWRRYHNTVDLHTPLEENRQFKKAYQLFCSGCTRRGHLVHTCRISLPFSRLPINSPYVAFYRPVYQPIQGKEFFAKSDPNDQPNKQFRNKNTPQVSNVSSPLMSRNERLKRQSKSPVTHETHLNKKRNVSNADENQISLTIRNKSPINDTSQRKNPHTKEQPPAITKDTTDINKNSKSAVVPENKEVEKAPDFISILPENRDKKGQMIQDNEVSDTSEVVTSARIYVTKEIVDKLKTEEGVTWMKDTIKKNNILLESDNINYYLSIKGTIGNQEAFQAELRDWISKKQPGKERMASESEADITQESVDDHGAMSNDIPKNRNNVIRKLTRAFESLKSDIGDPKALHRELVFLQNKHQQLLKQKVISPQQLSNNRHNINGMLRKLNMVLLGQAGLADGSKHLSELHQLQEKLTNFRQKNIPTSLREEIGQHFHCIFAAMPRDDYAELLGKFYNRPSPAFKNKNNDKFLRINPMANHRAVNPIQRFEKNVIINKKDGNGQNVGGIVARPLIENTKKKLIFYHRRLLRSKPMDVVLKKTKSELVKKLHWQIATLGTNSHTTKKNFKKMKKVQQQAQLFLTNI